MNAAPVLKKVLAALRKVKLEAVLFGNAGAAIHGSPITTIDFDFFFRDTPQNRTKLKKLAKALDGVLLRPYYPASKMFRLQSGAGLQVDFLSSAHGVKSFASLRSRASVVKIVGEELLLASLEDIIRSKTAAGRDVDKAVIPILEKLINEKKEENKN